MIIVDLETQNFPVESGIFEVACLVIENYEIVDRLYLGEEIKNYNGSTKYGFGFHDISKNKKYITQFREFISKYNYPLVAHNCPFDKKFLRHYEWISEDYPTYCSMRAIRMSDGSLPRYSLSYLVKHYEIAEKVEHTAMSDAENVYKLLNIIKPTQWLEVGEARKYTKTKARALDDIDLNIDTTQKLRDEIICFTGASKYKRNTMEEIAIKNGAKISKGVTKKTTILVVGEKAGSKIDKAQEKGISIISDEEFMKLLNLEESNIGIDKSNDFLYLSEGAKKDRDENKMCTISSVEELYPRETYKYTISELEIDILKKIIEMLKERNIELFLNSYRYSDGAIGISYKGYLEHKDKYVYYQVGKFKVTGRKFYIKYVDKTNHLKKITITQDDFFGKLYLLIDYIQNDLIINHPIKINEIGSVIGDENSVKSLLKEVETEGILVDDLEPKDNCEEKTFFASRIKKENEPSYEKKANEDKSASPEKIKFFRTKWFVILSYIAFWPLGIFLGLKYKVFNKKIHIGIGILILLTMFLRP